MGVLQITGSVDNERASRLRQVCCNKDEWKFWDGVAFRKKMESNFQDTFQQAEIIINCLFFFLL